jgi:hypothetical protein
MYGLSFSYVMSWFGDWLPGSVLASFKSTSAFLACGFLPYFLAGFILSFLYT